MSNKNITEIIQSVFDKNNKPFMTVKGLVVAMGAENRRQLNISLQDTSATIRRVLEPHVQDKYIFNKKGPILYILTPCDPSELIIAELSTDKGKSPKALARSMPFTKKDCSAIISELYETGRIKIVINDDLDTRIFLVDKPVPKVATHFHTMPSSTGEYTREKFLAAFVELDRGRIFVRIPDLRNRLNWPREVFDNMLRELRDREIIQLHIADTTLMTPEQVRDCFVNENNYIMGTVTRNGR